MVKAVRNFFLFSFAAIVAIGVLCFTTGVLSPTEKGEGPFVNPIENAQAAALNAAIDSSGVKSAISNALDSKVAPIAQATGLSTSQVKHELDNLAIDDWKVVPSAQVNSEKASYNVDANGIAATITTYDNPDYVTVSAYGQSIAFKVPESAQPYEAYLAYL